MKLIIILIVSNYVIGQQLQVQQCECSKIKIEQDCLNSQQNCIWELSKQSCTQTQSDQSQNVILKEQSYCEIFLEMITCLKSELCAWTLIDNIYQCYDFLGCHFQQKKTHQECQDYSLQCISDGNTCVFIQENCKNYKSQMSCEYISQKNHYCYWDSNQCIEATFCTLLPKSFKTDEQCRAVIINCTVNIDQGCINSGTICSDHKYESQCYWNEYKTSQCIWVDNQCQERNCKTLGQKLKTKNCKRDIKEYKCYDDDQNGCSETLDCKQLKSDQSCENYKEECYWNNNICIQRDCINAPTSFNSLNQCQEFSTMCVPRNPSGCQNIQECSNAELQIACEFDKQGNPCFWDQNEKCRMKVCEDITKQELLFKVCSEILPNCIKNRNGGCMNKKSCIFIQIQSECDNQFDIDGKLCFWNQVYAVCQQKICINSIQRSTHQQCNEFLSTCTINKKQDQCIEWSCSASQNKQICEQSPQRCTWNNICVEKFCELASKSIQSHEECYSYLNSCTLSNEGYGCMNIPLRCEAIKIQAACQIKITKPGGSKAECGWNGNKCINKDCSTAPQSLDNDSLCDQYMSGCVVKYVKVDQIFITNGCQELSKNCQFRYDAQQCIIQRIGYPQCVWDPSGNICLIKSCLTANIPNSSGALTEFNMSQCDSYLTGCIQNANQDGCINQPQLCVQLSSNNCFKSQEGICYLNNDRCLLKICSNINQNTHEGCFNSLETCTVNKVLTGCETLAEQCHTYVNQEQCKITITGNHCIWQSFYCRERECYDAPQISLYNSHINCQNFLQKCTVIKAVNGCETQEFQCSAYQSEQRCNRTFNQSEQNCIWINNQCYDKRELESIQCSYLKGTQQICRQYKLGCTNHDWADVQDECYFDCNEINLAGLSFQQCQAKSLTCSVNITGTKCVLLENSCDLYYQQESCFVTQYQRCFFENGFCYPLTSGDDCYKLQGPYSDEICSTKNNFCIANISGTSCIKREYSCQFYSTIENCTRDYSKRCLMINGLCTSIIDPFNECQYIQGNPGSFDHEYCQSFHSSCTGTNNKEQCYYIPQKCEDNNYNPNYCNHSVSGKCYYFYYTDICFSTQDPDLNCNQIIGAGLNFQFCQQYNSKCSVNSSGTHCIQGKNYCNYYTTFDECNQSFTENCIYILINQQTICLGQNQYFDCRMIYFEDNIYNHFRCNQKSERCTSENSTSCTEKTCQNYLGTEFNHQSCYTWNSKCTVSASSVKCELMLPNCTNNKVESCIRSLEGNCEVINNRCQFRNCSNAPQHFFTHAQCYAYQNQCTVAKEGGCIEKSISCNQFSQIQCFSTSSNSNCFWNPIKQNCVQANCDSIEETEAFDSHLKCFYALGLNNACTVRSLNGVLVPGCMMLTDCKNYEIQQQCVIGINYIQCEWIDRLTPPQCMDKSCFTASRNINTHLDCNAYFPNCTVSRFKDPNTNEFIIGGCQETLMCESYEFEIQCIVDTLNNACQWTGTQCLTKSCETAPISDSYSSNQQCMDYFGEDCVVSNSGQGCMTIKMTCEEMLLQDQCYKSKQGQLCIWDSNNMKCLPNSCSNIEKINNLQCSQLNSKCDQLDQQCRRLICEDLKYSTDFECEFHMKGCTTNGYHCVKRGSCLQVLHLNGCVKSNLGELCVWIKEDDYGYCDLAECSTAPISYKSDIQCKSHKTSCTVKKQGGCKSITTCENFEKQEACMMDINGNNCIWENEICRNFDCQDYRGFAFQYCQDFNTNCTIGKNGYCTQMLNCNQYKLKSMCYKGLDGLCKWIQDGSEQEGICMLFDQCQSLIFNTDTKCKLASKLCTTDGFKCVPLTSCNQTNVNGGCVQGTDGECIVYLDQQSQKHACKLFQTCSDAKFITHFDCQFANKKCTSNGVNCIEISSCNLYTKPESCVIDQNQQHCYWDSNSTCRDKVCKDYIIKEECIYNSCLWIQDKCESQKQKTCSDFLTQEECDITRDELDCIYNGFACVKNQNINCSSFLTRDTCYNHKNLKVCYWQDQKCQLFNRCSDADSNQEVCYKYPKNCIYSNNLCKTIDCSQYYIMNGNCQRIYNLENNIIKFCQLQNGSCAEIDPTTLSEMSCFSQSGQTFLWNTKIQKCESCLKVTSINNGSHNSTQIIEDMQSQLLSSILMNIILLSIY